MLTLYLVCLIFGGTLLALSTLLGGDHSTDSSDVHLGSGDTHAALGDGGDVHADVGDSDAVVDIHTDSGGAHAVAPSHGDVETVQGQGAAEAFKFLSLRTLIFFTAFFGLTGSLLTWMEIASALTLVSSVGLGGFASLLSHKLMNYLQRTESGEAIDVYALVGHTAQVVLPPMKTVKGKVKLTVQGHTLTLLALLDDSSDLESLPFNAFALIVRVEKDAVFVIEADYMK